MISLFTEAKHIKTHIPIASSKSESNRALIIRALTQGYSELRNLSSARDTQTLVRLLKSEGHVLDVIDAGTTMRFLTAYCCAAGRDQILTGTPRMCKRPIGILVEALKELGAEIEYWKQKSFPPLHIISKGRQMEGGEISIRGDVSSQFISALLMIAPVLKNGLSLNLTGNITSRPYTEMTINLMKHFGVEAIWEDNKIRVPEKAYVANDYTIESDWSSASYWYSIVALSENGEISLPGYKRNSFQGDHKIAEFMRYFGVSTEFTNDGIRLRKIDPEMPDDLVIDFTETPDLAQTIAVVSAAKAMPIRMKGLHTLRVKETDRIQALQNELGKFGVSMDEGSEGVFAISGTYQSSDAIVETYDDHRMAMAFAPLVFHQQKLMIKNPGVVVKSYPEYWKHLERVGVKITEW